MCWGFVGGKAKLAGLCTSLNNGRRKEKYVRSGERRRRKFATLQQIAEFVAFGLLLEEGWGEKGSRYGIREFKLVQIVVKKNIYI